MSLFDFFFPEQAQAQHLRRLADAQTRPVRPRRSPPPFQDAEQKQEVAKLQSQIDGLEDDLGYVALILGAVMAKLDEKGALTRTDVRAALSEIDAIDGVQDGKLDINILRGMNR